MTEFKFPQSFYFGAATSAHQVEGGNHNDWSEWEKSETRIKNLELRIRDEDFRKQFPQHIFEKWPTPADLDNYISGKACDHYNRFREDFDIAKKLGHNAHRFSIEWSRIEPEEGKFDEQEIEHYREVIKALRERGIEPFVTLWHWPLPLWLRDLGGWKSRKIVEHFSRYAAKVVGILGNDVRFWMTINEPLIYARYSYLRGGWPPEEASFIAYYRVFKNLYSAHNSAYAEIKKINPQAMVGIAHNMSYFEAYGNKFINRIIKHVSEWQKNFRFLNKIKYHQDFIGFNYYSHHRINYGFYKDETRPKTDLGWEIYPEGIYHVLQDLKKYGKPIYITENGLADAKDEKRAKFMEEHLRWTAKAVREGSDVRGYFYWSLLDNFEWDKGFWPRFGLVEVDYKTQKRQIRQSAWKYKEIIEKGLSSEALAKEEKKNSSQRMEV